MEETKNNFLELFQAYIHLAHVTDEVTAKWKGIKICIQKYCCRTVFLISSLWLCSLLLSKSMSFKSSSWMIQSFVPGWQQLELGRPWQKILWLYYDNETKVIYWASLLERDIVDNPCTKINLLMASESSR